MKSILYETEHRISNYITIKVPTVREILEVEDESDYFGSIALIVSTPTDMMVQLDDIGIDFTKISEWDLFCLLFGDLKSRDLSLIFKDLNFSEFIFSEDQQSRSTVLLNPKTGAIIDKNVYSQICEYLRKMLRLEKNEKKPANKEAKEYLIERARIKLNRLKRKSTVSNNYGKTPSFFGTQIEKYIVSLVNTCEFPYNYETVLELNINQFYASLYQIRKKIEFDNLMIGCYAGTVDMSGLTQDELSWILT